ncbi:MAG: hypothetical protein FD143_1291 [Ignavibacteria bacterium]|nr:MAG: hypothetical protein FD143_1291 [Ignavibacteria bacterium]KAF0160808.1 MAG: hypothetical protein FD188_1413 [Ignavibacteria bacterium]
MKGERACPADFLRDEKANVKGESVIKEFELISFCKFLYGDQRVE